LRPINVRLSRQNDRLRKTLARWHFPDGSEFVKSKPAKTRNKLRTRATEIGQCRPKIWV
jgi:hypothetical protein